MTCDENSAQPVPRTPGWLLDLLSLDPPDEGSEVRLGDRPFRYQAGILRELAVMSDAQTQTADTFGFKWRQRGTFESAAALDGVRAWLLSRYGDVSTADWWAEYGERPIVVDAGCGAAMSAIELFGPQLPNVRYLGIDVSHAVDVAAARFAERGMEAGFLQADISNPPLPEASVDVVFSEGVLHHTDSTEKALQAVARLLKPGGRLLFYVYRKKGPLREFSDDYIRDRLQGMTAQQAWEAVLPLTKLGQALGELDVKVEIPDDIDILGIPAGTIDVQRLFYWHVCKAFYRADLDLQEMNHINFDWFVPKNAQRQTEHEVRGWCREAGLVIEREVVEEAGITVVARAGG